MRAVCLIAAFGDYSDWPIEVQLELISATGG
jgi:hypothetical protein